MAKILYRPDLTSHLARHFSSAISPSLDRSLTSIVANGVIPAFNQSLNGAVEQCMLAVRREMVDVRKEVVKEQGEAVLELEEEVRGLRGELSEMRGAMERMERMLAGIERGASRVPAAAVASPRSGVQPAVLSPRQAQLQHQQQSPQRARRHAQQQQQQQAPYPFVPIPRAQTPPQAYEDMVCRICPDLLLACELTLPASPPSSSPRPSNPIKSRPFPPSCTSSRRAHPRDRTLSSLPLRSSPRSAHPSFSRWRIDCRRSLRRARRPWMTRLGGSLDGSGGA